MPKQRSTFYSFKHYFCEEQKKKGIYYANKEELEKAAFPVWMDTAPKKRLVIKQLASGLVTKQELREQGIAKTNERSEIKHFVRSGHSDKGIVDKVIYLIDVNYHCVTSAGRYLIGECSVVKFSLRDGVLDHYHVHVNPGKIPIGYQSDVKRSCKDFGLIPPDEDGDRYDWSILNDIKNFVQFSRHCMLFTMPEKVPAVLDFFREICSHAGEDPAQFLVYHLDYLFYTLTKTLKPDGEVFPRDAAFRELQRKKFMGYPGLCCKHHYDVDKQKCTTARAKSWAFTILEACCPAVGVDLQPGKHLPPDSDIDLDPLLLYDFWRKEDRFGKLCSTSTEPSACCSSANAANDASTDNDDIGAAAIAEQLQNCTLNKAMGGELATIQNS